MGGLGSILGTGRIPKICRVNPKNSPLAKSEEQYVLLAIHQPRLNKRSWGANKPNTS